jgi:membrane protein DedA with SNARE-associated domain
MPSLTHLISTYGYWGVVVIVTLESMGVPLPGESLVIAAAVYAGTTHRLDVGLLIVAVAAGAILGDNLGYWIGREVGCRLLLRYGRFIGLTEPRIKLGRYLFLSYGGRIVFFGRFVAEIRTFAALLAGANRMPWRRFLAANAAGGILWAAIYGLGPFLIGERIHRLLGPLGVGLLLLALGGAVAAAVFVHRNLKRLQEEAQRRFPGPA